MIYSVRSTRALDEVDSALRAAAQRHKFGVLNVLDIRQTLSSKGIELGRDCRVYDVCNPQAAAQALDGEMSMSAVLPCRISVFREGENTLLATVKPTDLLRATGVAGVDALAAQIEQEIMAMMDESV